MTTSEERMTLTPGIIGSYLGLAATCIVPNYVTVPVYVNMMISTLLLIYIGSVGSIKESKKEDSEQMKTKDAYMFPVIGSCVLFSLYLVFKFLPKEYVNFAIKAYFFIFGVLVLGQKLSAIMNAVFETESLSKEMIGFTYPQFNFDPLAMVGLGGNKEEEKEVKPVRESITGFDLIGLSMSAMVGVWYIKTNHWAGSNIFGMVFSIQGIEMLGLGSYFNGVILLSGLFFYDVFWVFGTDVMVTVAKSFDAPIKLLFPRGEGLAPSMLGLGDIVIPGIFIALLLRFDEHLKVVNKKDVGRVYFWTCLFAYFVGLTVTVLVMYHFEAAQPALLYLVPACLGSSTLTALVRGEFNLLWNFSEEEEEKEEEKKKDK